MSGADRGTLRPLSAFIDDEGGHTTVAMALALLLSFTLALFAGRAQWTLSRAAEVQEVADACSTAGCNVVARYATCAQVCDALILSMGVAGLVTCGAALVLACIPGAGEVAAQTLDMGTSLLESRASFARSAVEGLGELERAVPALVMASSIAAVEANEEASGIGYAGVAVPFPLEGMSDFSSFDATLDTSSLERKAKRMQDASDRLEEAQERADDALMRGWMADCGNRPRCMRERAATLAGLSGSQNPDYPAYESWTFGAALVRARTYYPVRRSIDMPENGTLEALVDSCARIAYYEYASGRLAVAYYHELADGHVSMSLPELVHNTAEARASVLYTEVRWPCTYEESGRVLHATLACPGATGALAGYASLASIDSGAVLRCEACRMDITDMGRVAAASTNIDNGFEHYWREIVRASRDYEQARNDCADAEEELKGISQDGVDAFEQALELLRVPRAHIVPPGAWGCVAVVARAQGEGVPEPLGGSFLDAATLPPGAAVSAAMLAPDDSADGNSVLAHLFDGLADRHPGAFSVLGDAGRLWGELIDSYGRAYDGLADSATAFLERVDGVFGTSAASWVLGRVEELVRSAGLEPADIRMLKPVLCSTQGVFERAGLTGIAQIQKIIVSLGDDPSMADVLRAVGVGAPVLPGQTITIAEIEIPGTGLTIPLEVDLSQLAGAI